MWRLHRLRVIGHSLAQLVQKDEGALVGNAQIAADSQGALAFHLVAKDRNGCQIAALGQLRLANSVPFFLACIAALELEGVALEEIYKGLG